MDCRKHERSYKKMHAVKGLRIGREERFPTPNTHMAAATYLSQNDQCSTLPATKINNTLDFRDSRGTEPTICTTDTRLVATNLSGDRASLKAHDFTHTKKATRSTHHLEKLVERPLRRREPYAKQQNRTYHCVVIHDIKKQRMDA